MTRVTDWHTAQTTPLADAVDVIELVPPEAGSQLTLRPLRLAPAAATGLASDEADTLLFAAEGEAALTVAGQTVELASGAAALLRAGEQATLTAGLDGSTCLAFGIGAEVDRHAALGRAERLVRVDEVEPGAATGSRSFQVLFGPHNGSTRATLFVGYIPPGSAPWHYHLYDEIVWVLRGTGSLHLGDEVEELAVGSAFRLRPREVHVVENTQEEAELVVLGLFTPAGSPSAAYLASDAQSPYAFAPRS